jgi:hypothetical protein
VANAQRLVFNYPFFAPRASAPGSFETLEPSRGGKISNAPP